MPLPWVANENTPNLVILGLPLLRVVLILHLLLYDLERRARTRHYYRVIFMVDVRRGWVPPMFRFLPTFHAPVAHVCANQNMQLWHSLPGITAHNFHAVPKELPLLRVMLFFSPWRPSPHARLQQ